MFLTAWSTQPAIRRRSSAALPCSIQCAETRLLLSSGLIARKSPLGAFARGAPVSTAIAAAGSVATATIEEFAPTAVSSSTGEKPQSKVWVHKNETWAVFGQRDGLYAFQFNGTTWIAKLRLSPQRGIKADVKVVGDVVHVLMHRSAGLQICSLQFNSQTLSYDFQAGRQSSTPVPSTRGLETATLEVDSTGRMWVAYVSKRRVIVRFSDGHDSNWSAAIELARGLSSDDIAAITARDGRVGVFWSNQTAKRFGYREHVDGMNPSEWTADEMPGDQTAPKSRRGVADDHIRLVVNTDGTLYVAAKTSYDSASYPRLILLVRRPSGVWDAPHAIDPAGTRPTIAVRAGSGDLIYAYRDTDGAGPIRYRMLFDDGASIRVGNEQTLIGGPRITNPRAFNNVSTVRTPFDRSVTFIASGSSVLATTVLTVNPGLA